MQSIAPRYCGLAAQSTIVEYIITHTYNVCENAEENIAPLYNFGLTESRCGSRAVCHAPAASLVCHASGACCGCLSGFMLYRKFYGFCCHACLADVSQAQGLINKAAICVAACSCITLFGYLYALALVPCFRTLTFLQCSIACWHG